MVRDGETLARVQPQSIWKTCEKGRKDGAEEAAGGGEGGGKRREGGKKERDEK